MRLSYRADIDGLRALAVLAVVVFHAFPTLATGGFIGVDVFFVISGFLITGIIAPEIAAGNFSLKHFYARRCRRILPALFIMLAATWLLGWLVLLPDEFKELGRATLAAVTFTENALLLHQSGYFDTAITAKPLMHVWSLAVEEQFYVFWPLTLLVASRLNISNRILVPALFAASLCWSAYQTSADPVAAFYMLPSRFWEILCGALAWFFPPRARADAKAWLALVILAAFTFLFSEYRLFPGWAAAPCIATALLLTSESAWFNRRLLSAPPLVFTGRVSYAFYLWHWPLLSLAAITEGEQPSLPIRISAVLLAFALAWLSTQFIEQKLRRAKIFSWKAYATVAAAVACLGLLSFSLSPRGTLVTASATLDRTNWGEHEYADEACKNSGWAKGAAFDYCRLNGSPRVAILGDSHANHLVPGLIAAHDAHYSQLVEMAFAGCTGFDGMQIYQSMQPPARVQACAGASHAFAEKIRSDKTIDTVIISLFLHPESFYGATTLVAGGAEATALGRLQQGLSQSITAYEAAGKQVVFVMDTPSLTFDPASCLQVRPLSPSGQQRQRCARSRAEVEKEQQEPRRLIAALQAQHPHMLVFDPADTFCDRDYCYGMRGGALLYRDRDHLTHAGSAFLAGAFLLKMQDAQRPGVK